MLGIELEEAPDALDEFGHILVAEGIAERQHGDGMLHLAKAARRRRADLLRRRFPGDEIGEIFLDRLQPLAQRVIGGVRYGRRVLLVVALVVALDLSVSRISSTLAWALVSLATSVGGAFFDFAIMLKL